MRRRQRNAAFQVCSRRAAHLSTCSQPRSRPSLLSAIGARWRLAWQRLREIEAVNGGWAMLGLTSGIVVEGVAGQGILAQWATYLDKLADMINLARSTLRSLEADVLPWWMLPRFHQALSQHSHPVALSPSVHRLLPERRQCKQLSGVVDQHTSASNSAAAQSCDKLQSSRLLMAVVTINTSCLYTPLIVLRMSKRQSRKVLTTRSICLTQQRCNHIRLYVYAA
eukprot:SM000362S13793  [mRNA]  locus=s362:48572:49636:- [translate_table: standard]